MWSLGFRLANPLATVTRGYDVHQVGVQTHDGPIKLISPYVCTPYLVVLLPYVASPEQLNKVLGITKYFRFSIFLIAVAVRSRGINALGTAPTCLGARSVRVL